MAKRTPSAHGPSDTNVEQRILVAAEKLFLENGYEMTSTTEIAKQAGCNQALVHYYFRTKERLFNMVIADKVKLFFAELLGVGMEGGTFEQRLTHLIEFHFDLIRKNSPMVLFIITELNRNPEAFDDIINELGDVPRRSFERFGEEFAQEIAAGRIRRMELMDLVINIVSMNAFPYAVRPVFAKIWGVEGEEMERLLDRRRGEVINTIMASLKPDAI